jgi:DNA modification methylase
MVAVTKDAPLILRSDARLRARLFGAEVMRHPAKQSITQLMHLLERFAVPGGVLLDCFGGSGSAMLAASPNYGGMYVICVELASHFRAMQRLAWEHFQYTLEMQDTEHAGDFVSIAGDSRNLPAVLGERDAVDLIVTSPSYGGSEAVDRRNKQNDTIAHHGGGNVAKAGYTLSGQTLRGTKCKTVLHSYDDEVIDLIVTSPPYQDTLNSGHPNRTPDNVFRENRRNDPGRAANYVQSYDHPLRRGDDQIVDLVVTSPPYHDAFNRHQTGAFNARMATDHPSLHGSGYDTTAENIGNQRGKKYLASMRAVWAGCAAVLKPGGILCCITRDCVQRGRRVPVGEQNRELLEAAGLTFLEVETWRVPNLSFWRQQQKRTAEAKGQIPIIIDSEEVWIFQKPR